MYKGKSTYLVLLPETYPFSKRTQRKREKRKMFYRQIRAGVFFFSNAIFFYLPIMARASGACYIKTRAHVPNGQHHRTPGMPCQVERFLQRSGGFFLSKDFLCISQGMKKTWLIKRFLKIIIIRSFFGIMRSELNCAISHRCITREALKMT